MASLKDRIAKKFSRWSKDRYQDVFIRNHSDKRILLIVGCQRSGTTMMTELFEKDIKVKVYGEMSKISAMDEKRIRLNPLDIVKKQIYRNNVPYIVMKPLVESQHTTKMFDYFEEAKALWMFRKYKDVASSNLKNFGIDNGVKTLRPIANDEENNWRSDKVSDETRAIVKRFFSEDMLPHDAAALFWYTRNILFYEQDLDANPKVMMCKYADFVQTPIKSLKEIYEFAEFKFEGEKLDFPVHSGSVGKGKEVVLSDEIDALCASLLERLEQSYLSQNRNL